MFVGERVVEMVVEMMIMLISMRSWFLSINFR